MSAVGAKEVPRRCIWEEVYYQVEVITTPCVSKEFIGRAKYDKEVFKVLCRFTGQSMNREIRY